MLENEFESQDDILNLIKEFHKSGKIRDWKLVSKIRTLTFILFLGNWKGVVQLYDDGFSDEKLLWFQPLSEGIKFLVDNLTNIGVQGVSSIGCGTGLLEWIISLSTGTVYIHHLG